jgi:hypothetical protein
MVESNERAWQMVKDQLEVERHRIFEEIRSYPPPITACDQQFNYLLSQRESIAHEIRQLAEISPDRSALLREFVLASRHLSEDIRRQLAPLL